MPAVNAMQIVQTIRSDDIRLLWLNNSYHVATLDNDKELIIDRVGDFFSGIAETSDARSAPPALSSTASVCERRNNC